MYTVKNYKTKKAIKDDLAAGVKIACYAPGLGVVPENGTIYLEGPHYPQPHKWYATGTMKDGYLVAIK
jgi:hypothetical protein